MYKLFLDCIVHLLITAACFALPMNALADGAEKIKFGYSQRIRIETTDNATHLDNDASAGSSYLRNRTSFMIQFIPENRVALTARLTNEFRYYMVPETKKFTFDELFFDLLNLKIDSAGGYPIDLIIGRQNINLGEGFLVMDGGPLDGSRSIYFNAALASWNISSKSKLSLIYTNQPKEDNILPIINKQHKQLVDQHEEAWIAYYTSSRDKGKIDMYFIWRIHKAAYARAKSTNMFCPGFRIQTPIVGSLSATGEAAVQFGNWGGDTRRALGGYLYTEYQTGWPKLFPKAITIGGIFLSGDDRSTGEDEGWDPIFGRWPKWSDSYIYTLTREKGVAYWSNLASVFVKTSLEVIPDLTLSFGYHHLMSPENGDSSAFPGGKGKDRGDLFIGKLAYKMNAHLSGHVLWESFNPGSYYFEGADSYGWMQMEMMLNF